MCADYWIIATAIGTLLLAVATFLTARAVYVQIRHDRLVKEMENLVAPLRSKINYSPGKEPRGNSSFFTKAQHIPPPIAPEYTAFWNPIRLNRYLGASDLRDAIDKYFTSKSSGNYEAAENALFKTIIDRYSALEKEIDRIESKHWWQFWK